MIVPAVLAGAALWFNATEKRRDQEIAQKNRDADQAIAEKRQQDSALDTYLATMTTLLLDEKLRESLEGSEVRAVARAQTLTVLRRLDEKGKGDVVRFVYESGLIYRDKAVLDLNRADLSGADLDEADLSGADLSGADLRRADLSDADLTGTKLTGAYLEDADLGGAKGTTREQLREVVAETLSGTQVLVHP